MSAPTPRDLAPPFGQRIRCFFGKHAALERTSLHPYPDAYNCTSCGRLAHLICRSTGARYSSIDQFLEERSHG